MNAKLTITKFNNKLREEVAAELSYVHAVELQEVLKNNNTRLYGLCIREYKDTSIAPIFYINDYYDDYCKGRIFTDIVRELVLNIDNALSSNNLTKVVNYVKSYEDYSSIKDRIIIKLINCENNAELLKNVPYIKFLDLAVTFVILVAKYDESILTATIKNNLFDLWNVTVDDVFELSMSNTKRLIGFTDNSVIDIYSEQLGVDRDELPFEEIEDSPMIIISTQIGMYGASALLYSDLLQSVADRLDSDLIIFPSSVHEVIAVRFKQDMDCNELSGMVTSINTEVVEREEVLSNNVYIYKRIDNTLSLCM